LAEDLQDQRKLFYCRYKKDLVYKGLNVKYFIKFFMAMKKKENGNFLSFMDLWKYKDAIMWAASMAEERLPTTFYEEIEKFLKGYKKELVKHGETATQMSEQPTQYRLLYTICCLHGQLRATIFLYGSGCCLSGTSWHVVLQSTPLVFTIFC
jgi:hypothetical protein